MEFQKTIKSPCYFSGNGIHTGVFSNMKLIPAAENTGITFIRKDLDNYEVEANVDNVIDTNRSTSIGDKHVKVRTVEHILAAVKGNEIDNLKIELDNVEVPILDGSCKEFSRRIQETGIINQSAKKKYLQIKKTIRYHDEETGCKISIEPDEDLKFEVKIDYKSKVLGIQKCKLNNITEFNNNISDARTFCFLGEVEELINRDLIKGGDLNNAIVISEYKLEKGKLSKLAKYFGKDEIEQTKQGTLNNIRLRYDNEPARHKLLDLIGDFSLIGIPIRGKITAIKPGHSHNIKFTKMLKETIIKDMKTQVPIINLDEKPIHNKESIKKILPHRDPFLFIDEIRMLGDDFIVGVKYVKENEYYFKGHFPGAPVMPGVIQLETMAQTGGVLILSTVKDPENYLTYFMKIDNAKFKRKVMPNDVIIFRLDLISPIRRGLCHMHGTGFVNNKIVVEADLLAQIAKKN